ncbi:cation:proton antiporter [Halobacteriales archaeon QS_5_70_17]|nr:MAG: cation:proton antiporter [Halobacteriales archaeon QS_5_70_17]
MGGEGSTEVLVPVGESSTLRNTVAYAVRAAQDAAGVESEGGGEGATGPAESGATVHFVYPAGWRSGDPKDDPRFDRARELLDRLEVWAEEDADPDGPPVTVETALVGRERYLFSPGDFAAVLADYAEDRGLEVVVVDPEYQPGGNAPMLRPLEFELRQAGLTVEEAPVERPARRTRFLGRANLSQFLLLFGVSYAFYLLLGGFALTGFELATGAITAGLVAYLLWRISLTETPHVTRYPLRAARMALYAPYLLWEIAKANLSIAYVVLHPDLPIDPSLERFEAAVWGDLPVTTLANSITLTPGTLTVEVSERSFYIHTLTASSREDLFDGALERAVRFVFYGRDAAAIPSPRERGDSGPGIDDGGEET